MKKKLSLIFILFVILSFAIPTNNIANADYDYSSIYDYTIDSYDISILVDEDNILHVTEKIDVFFNIPKHGIYRTIPIVNDVKRANGSTDVIYADISNISCSDTISQSSSGNNTIIKIGDPDSTLTGEKTYALTYDYELSNDSSSKFDELYYNLVGTGWNDTTISNLTFNITMPKAFDSKKLGFSHGINGSICSDDIDYTVNDKTISGSLNTVLQPNEAFTVRLQLPEGYFNKKFNIRTIPLFITIGIGVLVLISYLIWIKFGKDKKVFSSVEFYPPKDLNSAEASVLYNREATKDGILSLLVYLANKGYIEITEIKERLKFLNSFKFTRSEFSFTGNEFEDDFMDGLFESGTEVTKSDLENSFYKTINKIKNKMSKKEYKMKFFTKESLTAKFITGLFYYVGFFAINIGSFYSMNRTILFPIFISIFTLTGFTIIMNAITAKEKTFISTLISCIMGLIFVGMPTLAASKITSACNRMILICFVISLVLLGFIYVISDHMVKRNEYGNEQYQYLLGFKNFLETAEKPRLEALVNENPNYFYDILPYTYILNISKTWISKFESIANVPSEPNWYHGTTMFAPDSFYKDLNRTMNSVSSNSSSGGSSGGGVSGGGSGGGGGGSW